MSLLSRPLGEGPRRGGWGTWVSVEKGRATGPLQAPPAVRGRGLRPSARESGLGLRPSPPCSCGRGCARAPAGSGKGIGEWQAGPRLSLVPRPAARAWGSEAGRDLGDEPRLAQSRRHGCSGERPGLEPFREGPLAPSLPKTVALTRVGPRRSRRSRPAPERAARGCLVGDPRIDWERRGAEELRGR